jgi:mono/diheme cytochrome c family protein
MRTTLLRLPVALAGILIAFGSLAARAADTPAADRGKLKFQRTCAPCHGAGPGSDGRAALPGTDALRLKYKGQLPALLEARTDLTPEVLKQYVRRGSWSMPPFRKTELTDEEIKDIAAYLAVSSRSANVSNGPTH